MKMIRWHHLQSAREDINYWLRTTVVCELRLFCASIPLGSKITEETVATLKRAEPIVVKVDFAKSPGEELFEQLLELASSETKIPLTANIEELASAAYHLSAYLACKVKIAEYEMAREEIRGRAMTQIASNHLRVIEKLLHAQTRTDEQMFDLVFADATVEALKNPTGAKRGVVVCTFGIRTAIDDEGMERQATEAQEAQMD
jgi:hypothetical protein